MNKSGKYSLVVKYVETRPNTLVLLHPEEHVIEKKVDFRVKSGKVSRLGFVGLLDNVEVFIPPRHFSTAQNSQVWILAERICLSAFDEDGNLCDEVFKNPDDVQLFLKKEGEELQLELSQQFSIEVIDNGNKLLLKNLVMRPNSLNNFEVILKGSSQILLNSSPCKIIVQVSENSNVARDIDELTSSLRDLEEKIKAVNMKLTKSNDEVKAQLQRTYLLNQEINRIVSTFGDKFVGMDLNRIEHYAKNLVEKIKSRPQELNSRTASYKVPGHIPAQIRDIQQYRGGVGLVGQLATVSTPEVSKVLSWQCRRMIITPVVESENSEAGRLCINKDYPKLCLDLIPQPNLPSLPHGNVSFPKHITERPALAFNLLHPAPVLKDRMDIFQKVFISTFRGLIVMNSYDQAYLYRKWITQDLRKECSNIVTLDGQILLSTGITGGKGNRCPEEIEPMFTVESTSQISNPHQSISSLEALLRTIEDYRLSMNSAELTKNKIEVIMNEDEDLRSKRRDILKSLQSLQGNIDTKRRITKADVSRDDEVQAKKLKA
jgi:hypothetical protein